MFWSCFGALCAHHNQNIRGFLALVVELMQEYAIDIFWLNDARFLKGELDQYLPLLRELLPDCRVFQFPTYRIATKSRTEMMNRMGGGVAIVNYKWKGFVHSSFTDPMGLGILNSLDIKVGDYKFSCMNGYFPPSCSGTGIATLHDRLTRHQQSASSPT